MVNMKWKLHQQCQYIERLVSRLNQINTPTQVKLIRWSTKLSGPDQLSLGRSTSSQIRTQHMFSKGCEASRAPHNHKEERASVIKHESGISILGWCTDGTCLDESTMAISCAFQKHRPNSNIWSYCPTTSGLLSVGLRLRVWNPREIQVRKSLKVVVRAEFSVSAFNFRVWFIIPSVDFDLHDSGRSEVTRIILSCIIWVVPLPTTWPSQGWDHGSRSGVCVSVQWRTEDIFLWGTIYKIK